MREYDTLIPEMREWNSGEGVDAHAWISAMGNYELTIAFTTLFWPEFTIYDDCVFLYPFTKQHLKNYKSFMKQTNGGKTSVGSVMNHQHILHLFPNVEKEPTREQVLFIGRILKEIWQNKLDRDFPERKIVVSFPEDYSDDLLDYEITFFQEHLQPSKD